MGIPLDEHQGVLGLALLQPERDLVALFEQRECFIHIAMANGHEQVLLEVVLHVDRARDDPLRAKDKRAGFTICRDMKVELICERQVLL